jgi:hypothetical protein
MSNMALLYQLSSSRHKGQRARGLSLLPNKSGAMLSKVKIHGAALMPVKDA